ncbi:hypothetical protein ACHAWF_014551 [Thalassiosira exigua]
MRRETSEPPPSPRRPSSLDVAPPRRVGTKSMGAGFRDGPGGPDRGPGARRRRRIRRRLLPCCLLAACASASASTSASTVAADGPRDELPSRRSEEEVRDARRDATNVARMEAVASAARAPSRPERTDDRPPRREPRARRRDEKRRRNRRDLSEPNVGSADSDAGDLRRLIVGGTPAPPGRFPYAVSLQMEKVLDESEVAANAAASAEEGGEEGEGGGGTVSDVHACGGTLVAPDVVLTAGHCGYEELPSDGAAAGTGAGSTSPGGGGATFGARPSQIFYGADVGAYDLESNNEGALGGVDNMLFEKLAIHPGYTGFRAGGRRGGGVALQHDVMLVKLYGASDRPAVRLHDPGNVEEHAHRPPDEGEDLAVIGWGDTDPSSGGGGRTSLASVLHAATVKHVPNDACEESEGYSAIQNAATTTTDFESYFDYDGTISEDMMCALGEGGRDACQGDSGGGLLRLGGDASGREGEFLFSFVHGTVGFEGHGRGSGHC